MKKQTRYIIMSAMLILFYMGFWIGSFFIDYSEGQTSGSLLICLLVTFIAFLYPDEPTKQ